MGSGRKRKQQPDTNNNNNNANRRDHQEQPSSSNVVTASSPSPSSSSSLFLTSQDSGFEKHIEDHYKGFVHCSVDRLQPTDFHQQAKIALERLRDANYYQYDIVMAGGKHSSRTFVKRTLVGNPGITYKYLGLRLFAHAWSGPGITVSPLMRSIGEMNKKMIHMTEQFQNHQKCDYNLTLINYMEPTTHAKVGFKEEANYGMGKVSVSWHADSSLENGSSIGVYHCLPTQRSAKWDWKLALRPSPDASKNNKKQNIGGGAKPVVVNTKDGDAYFLLGNFNATHQHCVLAGSQSNRISSTHRVAVTQEDTYDYILKRVKIARKRFRLQMETIIPSSSSSSSLAELSSLSSAGDGLDAKVIRYCQRVLTEVEMEWIAQYWLQGDQHDKMHTYWQRPMKTLEAYWCALEVATCKLFHHLCSSYQNTNDNNNKNKKLLPADVVKVLINEFKTRQSMRQQWDERRADKIYKRRITAEYRPVARPLFDKGDANDDDDGNDQNNDEQQQRLPKDLTSAIQDLQRLLGKDTGGVSTITTKSKKVEKVINDQPSPAPSKSNISDSTTTLTEKLKKVGDDTSNSSSKINRPVEEHDSNSKKMRRKKKKKK